tara:strand:- start:375 stop:566 length:192 start_codon:yes stop_codon:yes gene_type:complete
MNEYEVTFKSTTYRNIWVEAENEDAAIDEAYEALDNDQEISKAWKEDAEYEHVEQIQTEEREA